MTMEPAIEQQSAYWDRWNSQAREFKLPFRIVRQGNEVVAEVKALGRTDLTILDLGCGTGWAGALLRPYGRVTGADMVPQTIDRARKRFADIEFQCGNLFHVPLPLEHFDVLVSLEVLAHVADQSEFVDRVGSLLKPNGLLLLSTQNRYVYSRWSTIAPPASGQLRHWVNATELRNLLRPRFRLLSVRSFSPDGDLGLLRFTESQKLNRIASALIGTERVQSIKERLMLGGTLFATAIRV